MTDILLLGTFHFSQFSRDIYSPEIQDELAALVNGLLRFSPDAVAVEGAAHQQTVVSAAYQKFHLDALRDPEKMRKETLGTIHMFGSDAPIGYCNETIQIGCRLAKRMNLSDVYAIDDDSSLDSEFLNHVTPDFQEAISRLEKSIGEHEANDSILELYRYYNSEEWSRNNHSIYMKANAVQHNGKYVGTEMVAQWYERNLKIFSNIQNLAKKHQRIFIVYGAGHLQILRELINADENLNLVDVYQYL